jgi:thiamine kinase-like enzyme
MATAPPDLLAISRQLEAALGAQGPIRRIEPLEGGITNRNYRLEVGEEILVGRLPGAGTDLLGINRSMEAAAARLAHAAGVGPEVITFIPDPGILVTRFIAGKPVSEAIVREPQTIRRIAEALRRVHHAGLVEARFSPFVVVDEYAARASEHGVTPPAAFDATRSLANQIEDALPPIADCFCHNDLLNANFIDDGEHIRIVDWEYAGMGDPYFDLGNFAVNHQLELKAEQLLLEAYLGRAADASDYARLRLMRFMSDFREAMWGVLQQAVSTLDFDFAAYASRHFDRLQAAAGEVRQRLDQARL